MPSDETENKAAELVARAVAGDRDAFADLYEIYLGRVYHYVYYRLSDQAAAEDLTEKVFLKAWERLLDYKKGARLRNFEAWIYRIAHNLVVDRYRTRKPSLPLDEAALPPDEQTPEGTAVEREQSRRLAKAVSQLPPDYQQVIACRFINELSHAETAEIMQLKTGHVRVLQYRALQRLRKLLGDEE